MRKTWMFASALLLATACNDDEEPYSPDTPDGGRDAGSIDSGVIVSIDSGAHDAGADASLATIALIGSWHDDDFGGDIDVTATKYGSQTLIEVDNAARTAITQNPADDQYGPSKYSKQVWTPVTSAGFYVCTQGYGFDTVAAAKAAPMKADPNDLAKGCGDNGFGWTHYVPSIELRGAWQSEGAAFSVDSDTFGTYAVESYDNASDKAVLSSGGGDAGAASYGKLVWTVATPSRVYYCIVATGLATLAEATNSTATADVSQPTTGCNGGAWKSLTK